MTKQEYLDIYEVVGVAIDVFNELGRGMAEAVYQEALEIEFGIRGMDVEPDHRAQLFNYMRISKQSRGVLINFGERCLHTERYIYLPQYDEFVLLNKDNYMEYITEQSSV